MYKNLSKTKYFTVAFFKLIIDNSRLGENIFNHNACKIVRGLIHYYSQN